MGKSTTNSGGGTRVSTWVNRSDRKKRRVPIRWGKPDSPTQDSVTHDLSASGLSIVTPSPVELGTKIQLELQLGEQWLSLRGIVVWILEDSNAVRSSAGIGVHLIDPPAPYVDYVRQLSSPEKGASHTRA